MRSPAALGLLEEKKLAPTDGREAELAQSRHRSRSPITRRSARRRSAGQERRAISEVCAQLYGSCTLRSSAQRRSARRQPAAGCAASAWRSAKQHSRIPERSALKSAAEVAIPSSIREAGHERARKRIVEDRVVRWIVGTEQDDLGAGGADQLLESEPELPSSAQRHSTTGASASLAAIERNEALHHHRVAARRSEEESWSSSLEPFPASTPADRLICLRESARGGPSVIGTSTVIAGAVRTAPLQLGGKSEGSRSGARRRSRSRASVSGQRPTVLRTNSSGAAHLRAPRWRAHAVQPSAWPASRSRGVGCELAGRTRSRLPADEVDAFSGERSAPCAGRSV